MAKQPKPKLKETEFTPESENALTNEEQQAEQNQKRVKMLLASLDREKSRIAAENGVRLGDSIFAEAQAVEVVTGALNELIEYYQTMIEND